MSFELPKLPSISEPPSSPSLRKLSDEVQKKIDQYRSSKEDSPRSPTLATVPEPAEYTFRTLADPIAAVEICFANPDYMIVGTYALLKPDGQRVSASQVRTGSISVVPLTAVFKPAYPGAVPPLLDEKCLDAAVLDIHFHPSDPTLLGVATSDAHMTFFRLTKRADVLARRIEMHLDYLGSISVAEANVHGEIPLITSFCWLPSLIPNRLGPESYCIVSFAATISDGDVKIVRALTPANALDDRTSHLHDSARLLESGELGKHTQEAWTVASTNVTTTLSDSGGIARLLTVSGGDDSALIATAVDLNPTSTLVGHDSAEKATVPAPFRDAPQAQPLDESLSCTSLIASEPIHLWTDRKTHTAGVVAILPLSSHFASNTIPLLTGSYDEHIRLFLLDTASPVIKRRLVLEKKLGGGVWRLKLMHEATAPVTDRGTRYRALILASCMHGGVRILRLTYAPPTADSSSSTATEAPATATATSGWHMAILAKFTKGHESMNYGSDFRAERDEDGKQSGEYTIVSTSFYDKAVCVWRFIDEEGWNEMK
jgi:diphthamide biosynthesis protein 7